MTKSYLIIALSTILASCALQAPRTAPVDDVDSRILVEMAVHARKASESMQRLAAMKMAGSKASPSDFTAPPGMDQPIFFGFNGPIEPAVKKLAEMSGYTYAGILGAKPASPVIIAIDLTTTQTTAFNVLMDLGAQTGSAVDIMVDSDAKKMYIKYPPVVRSGGYPSSR